MHVAANIRTWAPRLLGALLLAWAAVVLWREIQALDAAQVRTQVRSWGAGRLALAVLLAATNFALVAIVEWLGLRWSGAPLPWRAAALRSFITNGLIHSLGANVVTATLTRSWVYRRTGVRLMASATTTAFAAVALAGGLALVVGAGLLMATAEQLAAIRLTPLAARAWGGVLLAAPASYVAACAIWPAAALFRQVRLPSPAYAAAQVALGAAGNLVSTGLLWLLIGEAAPPYGAFVAAYALAYLAGLLSTVPGGAGVFEAALLLLLPQTPRASLAAGFMGFRIIFYLLPLALAFALVLADLARPPPRP